LALLAHELRNPLAPILNAVGLIASCEGNGEVVHQAARVVERQVHQMARLLDDLLDVSRISRGKLRLRKEIVYLAELVERAVQTSRPLIEARGHQLTVSLPEEPIAVEGDATRLEQVLANLLNNAAKYTIRNGVIAVAVEKQGDQAVVRIRDNGPGIPVPMLTKIFDAFVQVDRTVDSSQGGLGIGLTLVRSLVEMHGGRVEVVSEGLGMGTEFIVHLPPLLTKQEDTKTDHSQSGARAKNTVPERLPRSRKILVVDDNTDAANSMGKLLEAWGYEMRVAYDSEEALNIVDSYAPDVVLLDIGLPTRDGYQVAREIRTHHPDRRILLVAVSGYGQEEDKRKSREAGFDRHFTKPIDFASIKKILDE